MNSSGIKRGLAATAISALAVTGVPFLATSASAEPATGHYTADQVELLSQYTGFASTKNDGTDSTIRLEAGAGSNVSSVTFQYNTNNPNTWVDIATVSRNDDGYFSFEWNGGNLAGATVDLRAVSVNNTTADPDAADTRTGVVISGGGVATQSVNVTDGSSKGVFQAPYTTSNPGPTGDYVIIDGTTSATSGTVELRSFDDAGNADGTTEGTTPVSAPNGATTGTFRGIVDIDGYNFVGDPDELAFGAAVSPVAGPPAVNSSDDVEGYTLYQQAITTVTATAANNNIPASQQTAPVVVTVLDQNGAPIANAEVRSSAGGAAKYTDANGQASFDQAPGTAYYYANATDSDPYEPELGDKKSGDITVTQFNPAPTSLAATSRDGSAFDMDENNTPVAANPNYAAANPSDIQVQVKNQNGGDINADGQTLTYYWIATPFNGGPQVRYPNTNLTPGEDSLTANETGTGTYNVAFPKDGVSGTYELFGSLSEVPVQGGGAISNSKLLTVKAGESDIKYTEASPETGPAGGSEVVDGSLQLEDGTGLAGRKIDLTLQYNGAASATDDASPDAQFLNAQGQPAGLNASRTTDASGAFSVTVKDAAETPQLSEIGDNIDATTAAGTSDNDNPGATKNDHGVNFLVNTTPASVVISNQDAFLESPGEVETFTVTVMSGDQDPNTPGVQSVPLTNEPVSLTTDHGYFTDGTPVVTAGGDQGQFDNDGQAKTVTTNDQGVATFKISIGRDEGFDDDGLVTSHMTATAGPASDTQDQDWTSETPLNGGATKLFPSADQDQTTDTLPKAEIHDIVWFDVFVTDQFGNRVGGEPVDITDNTNRADVSSNQITSDYSDNGDFFASSGSAVDQKITASWTTPTATYDNTTPTPAPAIGTETLTDSYTVEWYTVDFANSTYTIEKNTDDSVPVGTTVTVTYTAVDQNGEPIENLFVEFFRNGPDQQQDGDGNDDAVTGTDGKVQYVFQGTEPGLATVTAVGRENNADGDVVPGSERETSVTFTQAQGPINASLELKGNDNGAADDSLLANAINKTAGSEVTLFRKKADGTWKKIRTGIMNSKGNFRFKDVADKNGNGRTKYKAVVAPSSDTRRGVGKVTVR